MELGDKVKVRIGARAGETGTVDGFHDGSAIILFGGEHRALLEPKNLERVSAGGFCFDYVGGHGERKDFKEGDQVKMRSGMVGIVTEIDKDGDPILELGSGAKLAFLAQDVMEILIHLPKKEAARLKAEQEAAKKAEEAKKHAENALKPGDKVKVRIGLPKAGEVGTVDSFHDGDAIILFGGGHRVLLEPKDLERVSAGAAAGYRA